ncbi:nucleotidyltransferase family protein [Agriterribacter sp.]|uniref:nucleotidyltransferase family protein n=1 Tax=Agriterribacter sp. TaxID=2821509 RepID=UPI002C7B2623|nr:nucleotidyltransferase family protein [Agriterribacter sp.]HRO45839.1 nucleotidyltransferase family protein [Agriterribacter sp.]HRQ16219.1 nucleotidyltransferase family protein [Agriterribacter sp.]
MSVSITKAIILAGGLGTRLRSAVPNLPKCMAPVNGVPFIDYVIAHFREQGIRNFIFALGYKSEVFESYLQTVLPADSYRLSIEKEPLGTGGAIRLACSKAVEKDVLVVNGDTLFRIKVQDIAAVHYQQKAHCTLALKPMKAFSRYGMVELNKDLSVHRFKEKQYFAEGLINGGVYALHVPAFMSRQLSVKFSFEKDYLERFYTEGTIFGVAEDAYFIDIGIPEDYERALIELRPDSRS